MRIDSYDLEFDVDFKRSLVKGRNTINVRGADGPIILNSSELKVSSVRVGGKKAKFKADREGKKLVIHGVGKGRASIAVDFSKKVGDSSIFGLYKSKYGKTHLLVTDLEPAQARTVFPCKDEPAYKAVFRVSVTTESGLAAISNTEAIAKEKTPDGRTKFTFAQTPRMSTYLFFLGVGKFEEKKLRAGRVSLIAATRPGQSKGADYVLGYSAKALAWLGKYYGLPYPLKKLHLVGLPEYHTGAMENWGAIAAREPLVVLPPDASGLSRQRAVHVMIHEIAHMWFGDLVTMKWWDDVWLNEAFATFMDYKVVDHLAPDWDSWGYFIQGTMLTAMKVDSLPGTHPIHVEVKSDQDLHSIFDAISYSKGAAVLRMLESYTGEEAFRKGVSAYLKKFSESNASGEDLWKAIEAASDLPIAKVAKDWTTKPGYPVVRASAVKGGVALSQSRFLLTGKRVEGLWPIPVEVKRGRSSRKLMLNQNPGKVSLSGDGAVVVNPGRKGFYSVLYDNELYAKLAKEFAGLHPHDSTGLLSDLYLFMHSGDADPKTYLRFVSLAGTSGSTLVARVLTAQLGSLWSIANESEALRRASVGFLRAQMKRIGEDKHESEGPNDTLLREAAAALLARTDHRFSEKQGVKFESFGKVKSDMRAAVAVSYALEGGDQEYDRLVNLVKKTESEVDRGYLYAGLTAFKDPALVQRALELSVSGKVPRSDTGYTLTGAVANPLAREALWNWLKLRYDRLFEIYGGSQQFFLYMDELLPRCAVGLDEDVKRFISGKRFEEGRITYRRTFEVLALNSRLRRQLIELRRHEA